MTLEADLLTPFEIYKRKDSNNYWMRFSIKGHRQQVRIGLKTSDLAEAKQRAAKEHQRYQLRAEAGVLVTTKSFAKVAEEYVLNLENQIKLGLKKEYRSQQDRQIAERYLVPFFGKDRIDNLTEARVQQFIEWRYAYWVTGPGKDLDKVFYERNGRRVYTKARHIVPKANTVRGNCAVLSNVLKFASAKGYIRSADIPKIRLPKAAPNPRPSFTLKEIHHLLEMARQRLADTSIPRRQQIERLVLYCYVDIACYSGLRPVELHNLNWRHLKGFLENRERPIGEQDVIIHAFGKTTPRNVVVMEAARGSLDLLRDAFMEVHGREPTADDPVFINFRGERLRSFKRSLNALLEAAGLKTHEFGGARVAYSFRHFYISQQLLSGVGIFEIAKNAGTSVEMVEKFYAKLGPEAFKEALRPRWQ